MTKISETKKIEIELDSKIFNQVERICKAVNHSIDGFINNALEKDLYWIKQLLDEIGQSDDGLINAFPETLNSLKKIFEQKDYPK